MAKPLEKKDQELVEKLIAVLKGQSVSKATKLIYEAQKKLLESSTV